MQQKNTVLRTFRISNYIEMMLDSAPYNKAPGLLVEILLDNFFDSRSLQSEFLRKKFLLEISKRKVSINGKITGRRKPGDVRAR